MGAAGGFWSGIGQEDVQVGAFRSEHDAEDHSPPEDQLGSRPHQAERHSHADVRSVVSFAVAITARRLSRLRTSPAGPEQGAVIDSQS